MIHLVTTGEQLTVDEHCANAIDEARSALAEDVPADQIGEHLEVIADAERVVTHLFECLDHGYVGWRWAVTVARADGFDEVTIDETVLLPGPDSLLARDWLPWEDRVQAGDLGVGDVLPTTPADVRLVPGYTGADVDEAEDDDLVPVMWELGLGRVRVLSVIGREEAAKRWATGDNGPRAPIAKAASEQCSTCGFLVPMAGPLGRAFGLCANEFSPSDGQVVALDHGCGAHSEAELEPLPIPVVDLVVDDLGSSRLDTDPLPEEPAEAEAVTDAQPVIEPKPTLPPEASTEPEAVTESNETDNAEETT